LLINVDQGSFLEDFRTLTPKARDIMGAVRGTYLAYSCTIKGDNVEPYRRLIASQKQFQPHLKIAYERSDTLLLGNGYRDYSNGRSCIDVMECKPWDQAIMEIKNGPPYIQNPCYWHPTTHPSSIVRDSRTHEEYSVSHYPDVLPSLTTGDSGPDESLEFPSTDLAFQTGLDLALNQISFFHNNPYPENNYQYLARVEKENYSVAAQGAWGWDTMPEELLDDGQGFF
jgi:hypothetical protein